MRLLTGYAKPIRSLAVTPDGKRLFSAAKGQSMIWEWDLDAGTVTQKLRAVRAAVGSLAVTPDGQWLVTAESGRGVVARPLAGGEPRCLGGSPDDRTTGEPVISIHPNGKLVATPWYRFRPSAIGFLVWDLETGQMVKAVGGQVSLVHAVAFCPVGTLLAVADRHVRVWDYEKERLRHQLAVPAVPQAMAFRPDGEVLAVATKQSVLVWEVGSARLMRTLSEQGGTVTALAYSPDGKYLAAAGADGAVILRDAQTNEVVGHRHLDVGPLGALCWLPDSRGLVVGGEKPIVVCEVPELLVKQEKPRPRGEPLSLAGHKTKVTGLAYSPDGRTLASWDRLGRRRFWDLSGGAGQARELAAYAPKHYAAGPTSWSPDGQRVAIEGGMWACLCDARTGEVVREFDRQGRLIYHLSFTPSGRVFHVLGGPGGDGPLRLSLRDQANGEVLFETQVTPGRWGRGVQARCLVFGEGDRHLYFALNEYTVARWTPTSGEVFFVRELPSIVQQLAVSPDERLLATVGGNGAHVWPLPDGKRLLELKHPLACTGVEFLPNNRLLTSCNDGLVRVWDLSGGAELQVFDLGMGKVTCLAVSPDHMTFAAGVEKKNRIVLMDVPE